MWPFKKRTEQKPESTEQSWVMYVVKMDTGPMVVRLLQGAKENGIKQGLQHQVGVATPLNRPNANGMHDADEGGELGTIEDALTAAFEADRASQFVLANVSRGAKEWVFYTRDPDRVKNDFLRIRDATTTHKLQLMIRTDADWQIYDTFAKLGA